MSKSVAVIIPTIGKATVSTAVASVCLQTYKNVMPIIVADGPKVARSLYAALDSIEFDIDYQLLELPYNTGANGFYGHRIYAAVPHLLDHDYILFLDEDNFYHSDHVKSLIEKCENNYVDFAYSLRSIFAPNGEYIIDDNCESLGIHPIAHFLPKTYYLVDTSSYCFRRDFIQATCHFWHYGWGGDRRFFNIMREAAERAADSRALGIKFACTGKHTLCYRLDGNPNSVKKEFFEYGNALMLDKYKTEENFPWHLT